MTLRSTGGYWILAVTAALIVFFIIDAVSRGAWTFALLALPWELLAVWVVYVVLVRPCIIIEPTKLSLVNVGRVHEIPWGRIREVASRYQLVIELTDGRRIVSWGAPTTGLDRPSIMGDRSGRQGVDYQDRAQGVRRPGRADGAGPNANRLVEEAHERWARVDVDGPTTVTSRLDVPAVAVALALVAWGIASALLG
ncbi:hypothetical protein ACL9RL_06575 [Plantibacter sp. Mn2098]|uniref:hypothetical protein n=1 Tax=Plantibacter sp. Mn2098 TaxID=3395266 RepID=UPI003BCAB5D3